MLLSDSNVATQLAVAAVLYLTGWIFYCRLFHPLHSIPGPFLASWSRAWIVYHTWRGDMEFTQRALHRRLGHVVRIAPNEVACSCPSVIQTIYGPRSHYTKTDFYDAWAPPTRGYVGHFPARNEKQHSERRRIVNSVYSMSSVLDCESAIDACTHLFCETLKDFAQKGQAIDLSLWTNMYAFDVLGELFYGKMFGFMAERKDVGGYIKCITSLLPAFTIGGTVPSYLTKLYLISTVLFSPSVRGALGAVKHLETVSEAAVNQRKQEIEANENDTKQDMIRKMLDINTERGKELDFTMAHICVESHSSIFAGADTTAIALNSVFYHLMRNSASFNRLRAEIDDAITAGSVTMPISYAQAIKLPYLNACINEGMRLHPSVGLTLPRHVPAGGVTIHGRYIPQGYRIGVNAAVVHYDQDIFGADASVFRPERWLTGDYSTMQKTMLQFGGGARTCIGKNVSLSEIYKLVPHLVHIFDLRLASPQRPWQTTNYWFNKQTDIPVIFRERRH